MREKVTSAVGDTQVIRARSVPIKTVIAERGIKLRGKIERIGPCPRCGGTDRFGINTKKHLFNCRGCDVGGDVISLVQFLDGCNFAEACRTLLRPMGLGPTGFPQAPAARVQRSTLQSAERIWSHTEGITGTAGESYLAKRGIALDDVPEHGGLRWHPRCPWESGNTPCIVARFTDAITGEPRGIYRRPVNGDKPKALGPMSGCVIRLWSDDAVTEGLVIGEGIETVLAAATRITHKGTMLQPAWACGCANNVANFPVLTGIEALTILVDADQSGTGQGVAEQCAQRWWAAGREVTRLTPADLGNDFNDMVVP